MSALGRKRKLAHRAISLSYLLHAGSWGAATKSIDEDGGDWRMRVTAKITEDWCG